MDDPKLKVKVEVFSREALNSYLYPSKKALQKDVFSAERRIRYFFKYLTDLGTKYIVSELEYISQSFLSDYQSFFSRIPQTLNAVCIRLHFFGSAFSWSSEESLKSAILSCFRNPAAPKYRQIKKNIQNSYLGYIVVRPIPSSKIGATVLASSGRKGSYFDALRFYQATLLGIQLKVESLVFQEQDRSVSACATCAVWTSIHKLNKIFYCPIKTPSQITLAGGWNYHDSGRTFPNTGLEVKQIGRAIKDVGLEYDIRTRDSNRSIKYTIENGTYAKSILYAYVRLGIPVLIGLALPYGKHLVTLVGYKSNDNGNKGCMISGNLAELINVFYVHDDQTGPYAPLSFLSNGELKLAGVKAEIESIIIPIDPNITINFDTVSEQISRFEFVLFSTIGEKKTFKWDIFLNKNTDYKQYLAVFEKAPEGFIARNLFHHLPRYIWVARAFQSHVDSPFLEIIFNAGDMPNQFNGILLNVFNQEFGVKIKETLASQPLRRKITKKHGSSIISFMEEQLKENIWI